MQKNIDYLVLGLATTHPLHDFLMKKKSNYQYSSRLYTVHWHCDKEKAGSNEKVTGTPYIEVAIL